MNVKGWMHTWMASHPWHTHIRDRWSHLLWM